MIPGSEKNTTSKSPAPQPAGPLRGVNLGGWLVLEKWMTPSVFADTSANDEYSLCQLRNRAVFRRIRQHRDTFITEDDFAWLARHGMEAVRLPVGYWMFGEEKPYLGTVKHVDNAFAWAKKFHLKILLCVHGAPGSQNGWDHSGRAGEVGWPTIPANATMTIDFVRRLVDRYGAHKQLLGIELLNEPKWSVPKKKLKQYYQAAYDVIRAGCASDAWIVFHDNFRPRRWSRELRQPHYSNVLIDTHRYQCFSNSDKRHDLAWHLRKTLNREPKLLSRLARRHPVIVGEWSLALDPRTTGKLTPAETDAVNRAYAGAQLLAYAHVTAWFYWSYKTERSATWSYSESVKRGWLPG